MRTFVSDSWDDQMFMLKASDKAKTPDGVTVTIREGGASATWIPRITAEALNRATETQLLPADRTGFSTEAKKKVKDIRLDRRKKK